MKKSTKTAVTNEGVSDAQHALSSLSSSSTKVFKSPALPQQQKYSKRGVVAIFDAQNYLPICNRLMWVLVYIAFFVGTKDGFVWMIRWGRTSYCSSIELWHSDQTINKSNRNITSAKEFFLSEFVQKSRTKKQPFAGSVTDRDKPPGGRSVSRGDQPFMQEKNQQQQEKLIELVPPPNDDQEGPAIKPRNWLNPGQNQIPSDSKEKRVRRKQQQPLQVVDEEERRQQIMEKLRKRLSLRKRSKQNEKPLLLLHAGLPKTGTTFLQCSLCANAEHTAPILLLDNLVYLGTCPYSDCGLEQEPWDDARQESQFLHHWHPSFFRNGRTKEINGNPLGPFPHSDIERLGNTSAAGNVDDALPEVDANLKERINLVLEEGKNALIIFEGCHIFSERHIHALTAFLLPHWDVHVVVAYRPLYDWLPSKYNSVNKPERNRAGRVWPNMKHPSYAHVTGAPILPFDLDNRSGFSDFVADLEIKYQQHPAQIVRDNYARRVGADHVHIMPLHLLQEKGKGDPMLQYLFCDLIPNIIKLRQQNLVSKVQLQTCHQVLKGTMDHDEKANPSVELNYDLLAVEAYHQGLFQVEDTTRRKTRRNAVAAAAQRRQEDELHKSVNDFPLQCLSNATLKRLEHLSLLTERKLFTTNQDRGISKNEWTAPDEAAFHSGFDRAVAKHKFCHIDAKKVLKEDKGWLSFFKNLAN